MERLTIIGIIIILAIGSRCFGQNKFIEDMEYKDDNFEVGQIWSYENRQGEANSTIQIVEIDKYVNQEAIIHISVNGLNLKNTTVEGGISETIGHLPFSRKAFEESITKLVKSDEKLTDFEEGYMNWKEAFETGKGGIFTISIKEAINYVEEIISK